MKKISLLLSILCLHSLINTMQNNEAKKPQNFKLTLNAKTGSIKPKKTKRNSVEIRLGYNFLHNDPAINVAPYAQLPEPTKPHSEETQISQEDI